MSKNHFRKIYLLYRQNLLETSNSIAIYLEIQNDVNVYLHYPIDVPLVLLTVHNLYCTLH